MSENNASQVIYETVMTNEKSEDRRQLVIKEMEKLLNNVPMGLDMKNRDAFNPKYNALKNFIFDINV